jgi:hypothetical protein
MIHQDIYHNYIYNMKINKLKRLLLYLIYLTFGYLLGLYYGYKKTFIVHGPNSKIIRKNIYYEIINDKVIKYKLQPYLVDKN